MPALVFLGILAGMSDVKTGKIKNSLIKKGIWTAIAIYSFLLAWTILRTTILGNLPYLFFTYSFFIDTFIYSAVNLTAGFILWKLDIWAAADAKLFFLLSLFVPVSLYVHGRINHFNSFALLCNIYIIYIAWLLIKFLKKIKSKDLKCDNSFQKIRIFSRYGLKESFIFLLTVCIIFIFIPFARIDSKYSILSILILLIFMFSLGLTLKKLFNKYENLKYLFVLIVLSYFSYRFFFLKENFIGQLLYFIIFMAIMRMAVWLMKILANDEIKPIGVENLMPKMLLPARVIYNLKKDIGAEKFGTSYPDGLTEEQCILIRDSYRKRNIRAIEVYKTLPFALFIFLGSLATFFFKGSIVYFLIDFVK